MGLARFFNQRFKIERITRTATGKGGQPQTWRQVARNVPGAKRPATMQERLVAEQQQVRLSDVVYFYGGVDVRRDDRLTNQKGEQVLVVDVRNPGGIDRHLELDCYEYQRGG
jgi:head-tail adaptor